MRVIGIDLGTTASVVATTNNDGCATVLKLDNGYTTVPSVVNYSEDFPIVGRSALLKSEDTVLTVKRAMGTNEKFCNRTPVEISADILSFLKKSAERNLGEKIDSAVITVPAHFSELQRIATKQAASLAGIKVLRLINEPTAAAMAFGLNKNGVFAVYDLGGGTFDFSVLRIVDGIFQVLATGGDNYLGGNDIDKIISEENIKRNNINKLSDIEEKSGMLLAKYLKEHLQDNQSITADFEHNDQKYQFVLDQNLLQKAIDNLLQKTLTISKQVLDDANTEHLDGIVLVGGMTKLQLVRNFVKQNFSDIQIFDNINPEEVVALGAAIQAQSIINQNTGVLLIDVVPLTLGIETYGGGVDKIIHRNTPIPISEKRQYTTYQNNQTGIKFRVVQGESPLASECRSLANFELKGIPPMPAGVANIVVNFSVDVNGLLTVTAKELSTGVEQTVVVEPSDGLSDSDMITMLEKSFTNREIDNDKARNIELVVDTNRAIVFWKTILNELSKNERKEVVQLIDEMEENIQQEQYDKLVENSQKADHIVGKFIDDIINNHLCGKRVK